MDDHTLTLHIPKQDKFYPSYYTWNGSEWITAYDDEGDEDSGNIIIWIFADDPDAK